MSCIHRLEHTGTHWNTLGHTGPLAQYCALLYSLNGINPINHNPHVFTTSSSQPSRDTQISFSARCSRKLEPSLVRSYDGLGTVVPVLSYTSTVLLLLGPQCLSKYLRFRDPWLVSSYVHMSEYAYSIQCSVTL